jgi:predicted DNA-binding transcriptional regulator AlpA
MATTSKPVIVASCLQPPTSLRAERDPAAKERAHLPVLEVWTVGDTPGALPIAKKQVLFLFCPVRAVRLIHAMGRIHCGSRTARMLVTTPGTTDIIDAVELATMLSIPLNTVYDYAGRGVGPPSFKIGRHRRWDRRDVIAWIEAQKQRRS